MNLSNFGLNNYESKVYHSLLEKGLSTAHQISSASQVPDGKIYPVLSSLEQKGFIKKYDGFPQRFSALDPALVLPLILDKKQQELQQLQQQATVTIKELQTLQTRHIPDPLEKIKIIEGYKAYLNLSAVLHSQAKQEWLSISRLPVYRPHLESYRDCIKRGVSVRLLVSTPELNPESLREWKKIKAEIRSIDYLPTRFSVIDGEHVILRISGEKKYLAIIIQNQSLAQSLRTLFESMWEKAKPV